MLVEDRSEDRFRALRTKDQLQRRGSRSEMEGGRERFQRESDGEGRKGAKRARKDRTSGVEVAGGAPAKGTLRFQARSDLEFSLLPLTLPLPLLFPLPLRLR